MRTHSRSRLDKTALIRYLAWPALALVAFVAWKGAWVMIERRRHNSDAPE
jgi:hypothetical protein